MGRSVSYFCYHKPILKVTESKLQKIVMDL